MGSFSRIGYLFGGVPIIRTIVFWGLYWGPPSLGNYHVQIQLCHVAGMMSVCLRCLKSSLLIVQVKLSGHDQSEEALTLLGSLFLSVLFRRRPTHDVEDKDGN